MDIILYNNIQKLKNAIKGIENELGSGQAQTYTGVICTLEGQHAGNSINITSNASVNKIYHTKKNLFKLFNRTAGTLTVWGSSSVRPFKDNEYYNGFINNGTYDGSPAGSLEYITDGIQTKWGSAGDAGGGGGKGTLFPVLLPAGKYTISGTLRGQIAILLYDEDAVFSGRWNNTNYGTWGTETNVSVTFEVTGGTRWVGILFANLKDTSINNPSTYKNIMLVEGESSATYEAYEGEVITESTSVLTAYAGINKIWTDAGSFDIDTTAHRLNVIEDNIDKLQEKAVVLDNDVIHRNLDQLPEVHACVSYGVHSGGSANNKRTIGIVVTTDVHNRQQVMQNAIDYLNEYSFLDMGVCLGDITGSYYNDTDGTWYTNIVNKSTKPFYTIIGNHDGGNGTDSTNDKCVTVAKSFDKWIKPTRDTMEMPSLSVPYYAVHDPTYGISMIFLNAYDVPDTKSGSDFVVSRGVNGYSQTQIDWFINELNSVPATNHLILFQHCNVCDATKDEGAWTQKWNNLPNTGSFGDLIPDIINAWITGGTLEQTYASSVTGMDSITVDADFTERGTGVFVGHVFGHYHRDIMAHSTKYSGQKLVSLMCTADGLWQNGENDLPRVENTKTQDAITILSVNKTRRTINLVRVGSTKTISMTERNMIAVSY